MVNKKKRAYPESIWADIDRKAKRNEKITKGDLSRVERFIIVGGDILDNFGGWVLNKQKLMEKHRAKLENINAMRLAQVI